MMIERVRKIGDARQKKKRERGKGRKGTEQIT